MDKIETYEILKQSELLIERAKDDLFHNNRSDFQKDIVLVKNGLDLILDDLVKQVSNIPA